MRKRNKYKYRKEDKKICIDLKLKNEAQFFETRDPSPFHERSLDEEAFDYIIDAADDFSIKTPLKLVVEFEELKLSNNIIQYAIKSYFAYKAELAHKEFKNLIRKGMKSLFIGLLFLMACIFTSELLASSELFISQVFREGLGIVPWVALWYPINLFLYDWQSISRKIKLYQKISEVEVKIEAKKTIE